MSSAVLRSLAKMSSPSRPNTWQQAAVRGCCVTPAVLCTGKQFSSAALQHHKLAEDETLAHGHESKAVIFSCSTTAGSALKMPRELRARAHRGYRGACQTQ